MNSKIFTFLVLLFIFSCSKTVFNGGVENRLIAVIDMDPENYHSKVDFTSDADVLGCANHEFARLEKHVDGSDDNTYYTIEIYAIDRYKSENNCVENGWYITEQEQVQHKIKITVFVNSLSEQMYIEGSQYANHPQHPTNVIIAEYKLERDQDGQDNGGLGIQYYGYDAELEIAELDLDNNLISGVFNATLYRATPAPNTFMGVDNFSDQIDLFDPYNEDWIEDNNPQDGFPDYHYVDSIRIEDCVFQRITVFNDIPY